MKWSVNSIFFAHFDVISKNDNKIIIYRVNSSVEIVSKKQKEREREKKQLKLSIK